MSEPNRIDSDRPDNGEPQRPTTEPPGSDRGLADLSGKFIRSLKDSPSFKALENEPDGKIVPAVNPAKAIGDRFEQLLYFTSQDLYDGDGILRRFCQAYDYAHKTILNPQNAVYFVDKSNFFSEERREKMLQAVQEMLLMLANVQGCDGRLLDHIAQTGDAVVGSNENVVGVLKSQPPKRPSQRSNIPFSSRAAIEAETAAIKEKDVDSLVDAIKELPAELKKPSLPPPALARTSSPQLSRDPSFPPAIEGTDNVPVFRDAVEVQAQFEFETFFVPLFEENLQTKLNEYNGSFSQAVTVIAMQTYSQVHASPSNKNFRQFEFKKLNAQVGVKQFLYQMAQKALQTRCHQLLGEDEEGNEQGTFLDESIRGAIKACTSQMEEKKLMDALLKLDQEGIDISYADLSKRIFMTFRRLLLLKSGKKACWLAYYFLEDKTESSAVLYDHIYGMVAEHFDNLIANAQHSIIEDPPTVEVSYDSLAEIGKDLKDLDVTTPAEISEQSRRQLQSFFDVEDEPTEPATTAYSAPAPVSAPVSSLPASEKQEYFPPAPVPVAPYPQPVNPQQSIYVPSAPTVPEKPATTTVLETDEGKFVRSEVDGNVRTFRMPRPAAGRAPSVRPPMPSVPERETRPEIPSLKMHDDDDEDEEIEQNVRATERVMRPEHQLSNIPYRTSGVLEAQVPAIPERATNPEISSPKAGNESEEIVDFLTQLPPEVESLQEKREPVERPTTPFRKTVERPEPEPIPPVAETLPFTSTQQQEVHYPPTYHRREEPLGEQYYQQPAPEKLEKKKTSAWRKVAYALAAVVGVSGVGVGGYYGYKYLNQSNADDQQLAENKSAPSATPPMNTASATPTTAPIAPQTPHDVQNPSPNVVPPTAEVLASATYGLGETDGATVYTGKASMFEGGVDGTPFIGKLHSATWNENQQKAATLLLKIYDGANGRFDTNSLALIKKHEKVLRSLVSQTDFTPEKFQRTFEMKFSPTDLFGENGTYNLLLSFQRILDLCGKDYSRLEKDTASIKLHVGSKLNEAGERYARAIDLKTPSGIQAPLPIVPGVNPANPKDINPQDPQGGAGKTGMLEHKPNADTIHADTNAPDIEYAEVDVDLSELNEIQSLEHAQSVSAKKSSLRTQLEQKMTRISEGAAEYSRKQIDAIENVLHLPTSYNVNRGDRFWNQVNRNIENSGQPAHVVAAVKRGLAQWKKKGKAFNVKKIERGGITMELKPEVKRDLDEIAAQATGEYGKLYGNWFKKGGPNDPRIHAELRKKKSKFNPGTGANVNMSFLKKMKKEEPTDAPEITVGETELSAQEMKDISHSEATANAPEITTGVAELSAMELAAIDIDEMDEGWDLVADVEDKVLERVKKVA